METLTGFKDIAPFLKEPLVLIGFVLLIIFGVHRALLKARIISPLVPRASETVVNSLLRYGFLIALLVIVMGFGLVFYQSAQGPVPGIKQEANATQSGTAINAGGNVTYSSQPSTSNPAENAAPPTPEKKSNPMPVNQNAKAERDGMAINAGGNVSVQK